MRMKNPHLILPPSPSIMRSAERRCLKRKRRSLRGLPAFTFITASSSRCFLRVSTPMAVPAIRSRRSIFVHRRRSWADRRLRRWTAPISKSRWSSSIRSRIRLLITDRLREGSVREARAGFINWGKSPFANGSRVARSKTPSSKGPLYPARYSRDWKRPAKNLGSESFRLRFLIFLSRAACATLIRIFSRPRSKARRRLLALVTSRLRCAICLTRHVWWREHPGLLELRVLASGQKPRVTFVVGNGKPGVSVVPDADGADE